MAVKKVTRDPEVPDYILHMIRGFSESRRNAIWREIYENLEDIKAVEEAEEHNRNNPRRYTLDEIRKEFGLA